MQSDLETESEREVLVADARTIKVPYVAPIKILFGMRFCYVGALVQGASWCCANGGYGFDC